MQKLLNHQIYELLRIPPYTYGMVDWFCVMTDNKEYAGITSHKEAVIEAFKELNLEIETDIQPEKMKAKRISEKKFFELSDDKYYETKEQIGASRCFCIPSETPYWYTVLETPYSNSMVNKDFEKLNSILFPNRGYLEVYSWETDFSSFFDLGKEWWGTGCWSVYDKQTGYYAVILASTSD